MSVLAGSEPAVAETSLLSQVSPPHPELLCYSFYTGFKLLSVFVALNVHSAFCNHSFANHILSLLFMIYLDSVHGTL